MSVSPDTAPIRPAYVRDAAGLYYRIATGAPGLDLATADARYINITGDTMTGSLTLAGNPTVPMHAVTKQYADAHTHASTSEFQYAFDSVNTMADPGIGDVRTDTNAGVPNTQMAFSDMTEQGVDASKTLAALALGDVIVFQQYDNAANWGRYHVTGPPTDNGTWWLVPVALDIQGGAAIAKAQTVIVRFTYGSGGSFDQSTADSRYVNVTGDTMSGMLLLAADPSAALGAATKQYVDNKTPTLPPETDAAGNTSYGNGAMPNPGSTTESTAFGMMALAQVSSGNGTAIGTGALGAVTSAYESTAVGNYSGNTATGVSLTLVGHGAGYYPASLGTSSQATLVGAFACPTIAGKGRYGAALGYESAVNDYASALGAKAKAQGAYSTAIGYNAIATLDNQIMLGTATERVYVNNAPIATLEVATKGYADTKAALSHTHTIADLPTGTTGTTVALGNHAHAGVYEPSGTVATHAATAGHELLSSTAPADLGVAAVGNGTTTARSNHVHKMPSAADVGAATTAHTHAGVYEPSGTVATHAATAGHELLSSTTPAALGTATVGVGTTTARADHVHAMPTAANVGAAPTSHSHVIGDLPTGTSGTTVAVGNHTHTYEASGAVATHDALATAHSALRGTVAPVANDAAAAVVGVATKFAREDHKHSATVAAPVALGAANAAGSATSLARSDHVHIYPTLAALGAAATSHTHLIADLPVATSGTSNTTQVVRADDSRLSNARTPTTHTHVATTDLTATGTKDTTTFLRGDNTWGVPPGGLTQAAADLRYVELTGDTLTGALILAADPAVALGAATKQYADQFNEVYVGTTAPGATFDLWVDTNAATGVLDPVRGTATANTAGGWANNCPVDKQGAVCTLIMNCSKATWNGGETVCTLPVGFRPSQDVYFACLMSNSGGYNFVRVASTGAVITGLAGTTQGGLIGTLTFFTAY